jgi:hypothetical protein
MNQYNYEMQQYMNRQYFIGPHCSGDGRTITLAVYKDQYCSVLDSDTTVKELIGYDPVQQVELVPEECISCGVNANVSTHQSFFFASLAPIFSPLLILSS